jgi:hypothetical protein
MGEKIQTDAPTLRYTSQLSGGISSVCSPSHVAISSLAASVPATAKMTCAPDSAKCLSPLHTCSETHSPLRIPEAQGKCQKLIRASGLEEGSLHYFAISRAMPGAELVMMQVRCDRDERGMRGGSVTEEIRCESASQTITSIPMSHSHHEPASAMATSTSNPDHKLRHFTPQPRPALHLELTDLLHCHSTLHLRSAIDWGWPDGEAGVLAGTRAEEAKEGGEHTSIDTYTILSSY